MTVMATGLMSDDEFAEFCSEHPDMFIEMTAEGDLIVSPPAYTLHGVRNSAIGSQLLSWADRDERGVVLDSSGGFVLPNGARRSADASWVARSQIARLDSETLNKYWHLCPDFIIELRSTADRLRMLQKKMREWVANGAQLAWLIDPERRVVEVYRPGCEPQILEQVDYVDGVGPVEGFRLDLLEVWEPLS